MKKLTAAFILFLSLNSFAQESNHQLSCVPSVTIVASPPFPNCGGCEIMTAFPVNGGSAPAYQWTINGFPVAGANDSVFNTCTLNDGDVIGVTMTSNDTCANPLTATTQITAMISATVTPSVAINTLLGPCYEAVITGGGVMPSMEWKVNALTVQSGTIPTLCATFNDGDQLCVIITSNLPCAIPPTATSCIIVDLTSSAEELIADSHLSIFPNPAQSIITISDLPSSASSIEIFNMLGAKIYTSTISASEANGKPVTVSCKAFSQGVYFVRVMGKGGWLSKKFVKD